MHRSRSPIRPWSAFLATVATMALAGPVDAQGTAVVRVETRMDHPDVRFSFWGATEGTISPGEQLQATGLAPGRYSIGQPAPSPWLTLIAVECDDQQSATPSTGSVTMRAANFYIDGAETVTCTFVYDGFEQFLIPEQGLPSGAGEITHPKPGVWEVINWTGSMQCPGLISRELTGEDRNRGELFIRGEGQRLFGDAFNEDDEDVLVYRVPEIPGRYSGWVSATYEGQTVTLHAVYQLLSDEWIVGYMAGEMAVETMFCRLYRPFEIQYRDPPRND